MPRILILSLFLAACGADGPPEPPGPRGAGLSGEASLGVVRR
ncbi:MAG TPA: hypothetical protein PKD10_00615 [Paracoccaceae bacterium]|nr:hypothetical protein [Paracoccaceae bacterium]HMO73095.1 hypothetical protein [Paracoccaceae bacterium]